MGRHSKRTQVLDAAETLFANGGFAATGINQITQSAGVAPMTLYNNFRDKGALVDATLARRSDRMLLRIKAQINDAGSKPKARILAVFDAVALWISEELKQPEGFTGCIFLKAVHEYNQSGSSTRDVALDHKQQIIALFEHELSAIKANDPHEVALELHLILDGAITQAQLLADPQSAIRAQRLAGMVLSGI